LIGRLVGTVIEKHPPEILIDVNGVGYEVQAPMTTFYHLQETKSQVTLHTHFSVSENAQQLFGFISKRDRALFRLLIKVNGVGPKMALGIMSGMEVDEFVLCVKESQVQALVKVPGIGKKTAERLVVEMRDKLESWESSQTQDGVVVTGEKLDSSESKSTMLAEAESALIALGYKPAEAARVIAKIEQEKRGDTGIRSSEELIRLALRNMMPL